MEFIRRQPRTPPLCGPPPLPSRPRTPQQPHCSGWSWTRWGGSKSFLTHCPDTNAYRSIIEGGELSGGASSRAESLVGEAVAGRQQFALKVTHGRSYLLIMDERLEKAKTTVPGSGHTSSPLHLPNSKYSLQDCTHSNSNPNALPAGLPRTMAHPLCAQLGRVGQSTMSSNQKIKLFNC